MTKKERFGIELAAAALSLGVAADLLLRSTPWGLNVFIWTALFAVTVFVLKMGAEKDWPDVRALFLFCSLVFFSLMFAFRDSAELFLLNLFACFLIGTLIFLPAIGLKAGSSGVVHFAVSSVAAFVFSMFLPFVLLFHDIDWNGLVSGGRSKKLVLVLRGALIAAPLVFIFGALLMSADASFQRLIEETLRIDPEAMFLHAFFTALFGWPVAGFLRAMTLGRSSFSVNPESDKGPESVKTDFAAGTVPSVTESESRVAYEEAGKDLPVFGNAPVPSVTSDLPEEPVEPAGSTPEESAAGRKFRTWSWQDLNNTMVPKIITIGAVETGVILGALNLLFLLFVTIQIPYLFGGMELVQNTPDLKLADYARRGFGELVVVSALVLPLLMSMHWLLRKEKPSNTRTFRLLAVVQIGLLFVIMLSAFQRLLILTGELGYGMTTVRFYPMVFMIWLAVLFMIFGYTVLKGARERFAWHAAISGLIVVAALNFFNPDDYIVRTNLELMREGRSFDAEYNSSLSADAVPVLMEFFPELNEVQKDTVLGNLADRECRYAEKEDLRTWNHSRESASSFALIKSAADNQDCTGSYEYHH